MDKKGKLGIIGAFALVLIIGTFVMAGQPKAPAAVKNSCSDTDGGNVPTVYGTTSGYLNKVYYSHNDYCVDSGNVNEYYCSGTSEQSLQESCGTDGYVGSNYCMNGSVYRNYTDYSCSSGACGSSTSPVLQTTCQGGQYCSGGQCLWNNTCSDTDGGYVPLVAGTVSGVYSGQPYSYSDYCNSTTVLIEYRCSGNASYGGPVYCNMNYTGCASGACYI